MAVTLAKLWPALGRIGRVRVAVHGVRLALFAFCGLARRRPMGGAAAASEVENMDRSRSCHHSKAVRPAVARCSIGSLPALSRSRNGATSNSTAFANNGRLFEGESEDDFDVDRRQTAAADAADETEFSPSLLSPCSSSILTPHNEGVVAVVAAAAAVVASEDRGGQENSTLRCGGGRIGMPR